MPKKIVQPEPPKPALIDLQDASQHSAIPPTTLRDMLKRGVLTRVRVPGVRRVYLDREVFQHQLDAWRKGQAS
jgi:hypothetical protein